MIYLVPTAILTPDAIRGLKQRAAMVLQNVSQRQNGGVDVVARDLTATDLAIGPGPNPATRQAQMNNGVALAANVLSPNLFPNAKLQQGQVAVVYGFTARQAAPHINELTFIAGTKPVAQVRIPGIYCYTDRAQGYLSEPIYWTQNQIINVQALSDAAVLINAEAFELMGFIGEKDGDTITFQSEIDAAQSTGAALSAPFKTVA